MAKAAFHKSQRVFVKPVGTWAIIEKVLPQWVKGLDEPLKIFYDVGLGREFSATELAAEKVEQNIDFDAELENWRIGREKNRWRAGQEVPDHPHPGSFPVVMTDDRDWGGWRVPIAEYDRDPDRVEFQAKMIEAAPAMMAVARSLSKICAESPEEMRDDVLELATLATTLLRQIYETPDKFAHAAE
jgi:hypothetical protein